MTRLTTTPIAVSADYHDALVAARRAKNWLFLLLLLGLLAQITVFFLVKFEVVKLAADNEATMPVPTVEKTDASPTSAPSTGEIATAKSSVKFGSKEITGGALAWVTNSIVYLGTIFSIVMTIVLLLIVLIMLVGRLLGVSHTTSAFVWAVILAALLFPWQLFYGPETAKASANATATAHNISIDDFRVPGVLFTWGELVQGVNFDKGNFDRVAVLRYARFVGFPVIALFLLFMVQAKSGRGVKYALGEAEVHVDVTTGEM